MMPLFIKKSRWIFLAAALVLLSGCIVTSVCPFYTEKDTVFESALVGDWVRELKDSPAEVWKFEPLGSGAYRGGGSLRAIFITLIEQLLSGTDYIGKIR